MFLDAILGAHGADGRVDRNIHGSLPPVLACFAIAPLFGTANAVAQFASTHWRASAPRDYFLGTTEAWTPLVGSPTR